MSNVTLVILTQTRPPLFSRMAGVGRKELSISELDKVVCEDTTQIIEVGDFFELVAA